MLIIAGTVRCQSDDIEAFHDALKVMMAASQAEDGCVSYDFASDLSDPTLLHLFEEWESQEHLAAHAASEHMAAFRAQTAELGPMERNLSIYDASNKKPLG